ncbi:hypothetical protein AUK11_02195 [bacterium CG2_30_37_16]|nr:MAG: hypothetical protein AUK11_02195 [bacterium CG2_30_37_16]PJB07168.1 MAG: hypothetical protein CO123_00725 [bacterium (Candidatus Howlettbacteria) CG_4_9_14_3_um_filter_37_10]
MEGLLTKTVFLSFFVWWYIEFPKQFFTLSGLILKNILANFSLGQIMRTLFLPWRRIEAQSASGAPKDRWDAFTFNIISRLVGFMMRIGLLITALIVVSGFLVLWLIAICLWVVFPFLPFMLSLYSLRFL